MNGPLIELIQGIGAGDVAIVISALVVIIVLLLVCFPVHEFAHAYVATKLGDNTPSLMGRVTLNPLAHLDPFGSLLFLLAGFGWAKPVPVSPYRMNGDPRTSHAIVALAGPASNILLAILFAALYRLTNALLPDAPSLLTSIAFYTFGTAVFLNLLLALFNLIPIPPLDGSRILTALLPAQTAQLMEQLERYGFLILMLLFVAIPGLLGGLITAPASDITRFLLGM
jgi:Zn-dependent protease